MEKRFVSKSGVEYPTAEARDFMDLLIREKASEALIFAARMVVDGKLGTWYLKQAVERYDREKTKPRGG